MKQSEQFYKFLEEKYPSTFNIKDTGGIKDWVDFAHSCFLAGYSHGTQDFSDQIKAQIDLPK